MDGIFHLLYVTVIVDMVHAVAVVAIAFGAVTKFHVWMICIGHAAYGAFVEITLSGLNILLCLFEVDGLGAVPMGEALLLALYTAEQFLAKEQEVVQNSKNGQQGKLPVAGAHVIADVIGEESGIQPGQPLDFERNQTVKKNAGIRIKGGEGEEHGHIDIVHTYGSVGNQSVKNVKYHTQYIEQGKSGGTHVMLQRTADPVVEERGHGKEEYIGEQTKTRTACTAGGRNQNESDQTPELTGDNGTVVEEQQVGNKAVCEHIQKKYRDIT